MHASTLTYYVGASRTHKFYCTTGLLGGKTIATTDIVSTYAPLANPAFTGIGTLGGQFILTVPPSFPYLQQCKKIY